MSRLVGNRSLIYQRNALVLFYMLPYYLEYIEFRVKQVGSFNCLHLRSVSKLRCMEMHAGLKARGIMMVHILHPLLVMAKDKTLGYKFLDQKPYVQQLDVLATQMQEDPRCDMSV